MDRKLNTFLRFQMNRIIRYCSDWVLDRRTMVNYWLT